MKKFHIKRIGLDEFSSTVPVFSLTTGFFLALDEARGLPFWSYVLEGLLLSLGCLLLLGGVCLIIIGLWNYFIASVPSDLEETEAELSRVKLELYSLKKNEVYLNAGKFFADYACIVPEVNPENHYHFFDESCPELNIKETPFYIYNKSTVLSAGLTACPHCYEKNIRPDEPR